MLMKLYTLIPLYVIGNEKENDLQLQYEYNHALTAYQVVSSMPLYFTKEAKIQVVYVQQ